MQFIPTVMDIVSSLDLLMKSASFGVRRRCNIYGDCPLRIPSTTQN